MMGGKIVVPGEIIAEGSKGSTNSYAENGEVRSEVVGLADEKGGRVIALNGQYVPREADWVIGVVDDVRYAGCNVEIKSAYKAFILTKLTRIEFRMGDVVGAKIERIDEAKNIDLAEPRRLAGGEILEISAVKVPRVIGKANSMINLLIKGTGSEILVGRNGRIWIKGGNSALAVRAILMIERESHKSGLTDRITDFLQSGGQSG
ncbi:Exosome complex component Rrp4 [Candidatus Burarchaeum australiense]|nr:Exosome complex component Rrp4 [Candidatus Burarchaeum australiense]